MLSKKYVFKIMVIVMMLLTIMVYCNYNKNHTQNKMQYRDSVLIDYVLKYCFTNQDPKSTNWASMKKDKLELKHPFFKYFMGNIYYSSDTMKAIAYYAYSIPEFIHGENNSPAKYYYGSALALVRNSKYMPWEIYDLNYVAASGWDNKEDAFNVLEDFYHNEIRYKGEWVTNPNINFYEFINKIGMFIDSNGKVNNKPNLSQNDIIDLRNKFYDNSINTTFKNKYTLDDPEFWSESIIWKKGLRVPWLYNFQTNSHIIAEDQIIEYNIPYPDSIIQMYKK